MAAVVRKGGEEDGEKISDPRDGSRASQIFCETWCRALGATAPDVQGITHARAVALVALLTS